MGEMMKLTRDRIEEIAREVYRCDRFTPTDEVWCNLHWLTLFAEAVERETLTEKDREIERLKAELDINRKPAQVLDVLDSYRRLASDLSASQAREREAREEARINLESAKAEGIDRDAMLARAMQAEAREREAVERAEKAELGVRLMAEKSECPENVGLGDWLSALAAARKALEANRAAVRDACHAVAIYGDQPPQMYLDALTLADAALNGDSHAGGES